MARAETLKTKHAIETQQEEMRKQKEQLELDAEIAASTVKIAVLSTAASLSKCSCSGSSRSKGKVTQGQTSRDVTGNGIFNSTRSKMLNPQATAYVPMGQISAGTAGATSNIPSQSVGATSNMPSQSTKMLHKGGLNTHDSSTHQHQDSRYFVQHYRGNMTTSQAVDALPNQNSPL